MIAQAWATWPEGASAPNITMMCRGHGVPEMVAKKDMKKKEKCEFLTTYEIEKKTVR